MRIRDLIPDREALISPDFYRRKNLLVQVIRTTIDCGTRRLDTTARLRPAAARRSCADRPRGSASGRDPRRQPRRRNAIATRDAARQRRAQRPLRRRRDRRAARATARAATAHARGRPAAADARTAHADDAVRRAELGLRDDRAPEPGPEHPGDPVQPRQGRAAGRRGEQHRAAPGDVVTVFSQKDVRVPVARQTRLVSLEGEVSAPGVYQLLPGETLRSCSRAPAASRRRRMSTASSLSREETRQRQRENLRHGDRPPAKRCRRRRRRAKRRTGATMRPAPRSARWSAARRRRRSCRACRGSSRTAGSRSS